MAIDRSGPVPQFFEYVTKHALITRSVPSNQKVIEALGIYSWLEIPSFQRGLAWDLSDTQSFLDSSSILLGNVILADVKEVHNFKSNGGNYKIIVDGLQRFSIGTMLLNLIDQKVFNPSGPYHSSDYCHFNSLATWVQSFSPVYKSNDNELKNHSRKAISDNYISLRHEVDKYLEKEFKDGKGEQLAKLINNIFLKSQIAIDIYYNFSNIEELMKTFLGINTVRVDLSNVDLLRAMIIDRGTRSAWTPDEISTIENRFTDVFTSDNSKDDSSLLPFVSVILKEISKNGDNIFPSWSKGLKLDEVESFLSFVNDFKSCKGENGFYDEIRECGANAFAILLVYYYISSLKSGKGVSTPSFISGGNIENTELYEFLRSIYRVYILASIGKIRHYAERIISDSSYSSLSLKEIAEKISINEIKQSLTSKLDGDLLKANIEEFNKDKSKRIFNALLLPLKTSGTLDFNPVIFGRKKTDFNIDHLIPDSSLGGNAVGQTIRNFAPLPQPLNNTAKHTPCKLKLLDSTNVYQHYIYSSLYFIHPYCEWLVDQAKSIPTPNQNKLDEVEYLEKNKIASSSGIKIGDDRITYITNELLDRL